MDTPALITIDDYAKVDLRVGRVLTASRHPDPKVTKLLVLSVDLGEKDRYPHCNTCKKVLEDCGCDGLQGSYYPDRPRTILAGIALHYTPEEMVGKNIIVVANLAPREMRGILSHGMLLAAGDSRPYLLGVDGCAPGDRVG